MAIYKNYLLPNTIEEALQLMNAAPADSRYIAGGTDLLLDLQQGRLRPVDTLVDITRIAELASIEVRDGLLAIGAAVPLNQVVADQLVCMNAQALSEAAGLIGGPQVRNSATLGGNVAHALPAADGTIALSALGAQARVVSPNGIRTVEMKDLFLGPGRSALDPRQDLLTGFLLPLRKTGEASAFRRVMRPQGVALPILNAAVWLRRDGDRIAEIRIAIGPGGPVPLRATQAEAALTGQAVSPGLLEAGLGEILAQARFRSSAYRSGSDYRRHLTRVVFEEAFQAAWGRAGEQGS
jgi:carbon-monoxide dehydrogenase medium subunit